MLPICLLGLKSDGHPGSYKRRCLRKRKKSKEKSELGVPHGNILGTFSYATPFLMGLMRQRQLIMGLDTES